MERENHKQVTIDVRELPPSERHSKVIDVFTRLSAGEGIRVVSDHEPIHLIAQIKHSGIPIDDSAYSSTEREDGSYESILVKGRVTELNEGVKITSMDLERHYLNDMFSPVGIYSADNYRVILTYIRRGQCIPVHSPKVDLIFAVIKGAGTAIGGNQEFPLEPGSIIIVPRGKRRGITAKTDMEAIHFVSPVPNDEDHMEVQDKIAKGECA